MSLITKKVGPDTFRGRAVSIPHTLFQLPRLLVESEGFDVVLVRLIDHGVRYHLSVHPPEHDLRSDDVLGSRGNRLSLV